jgi:hypothetical protein
VGLCACQSREEEKRDYSHLADWRVPRRLGSRNKYPQ